MAGLFDFLNAKQQRGVMDSLLSPEQRQQQQSQSLMGLGQGLLAASGPSRMPVSMGQALGSGMQGMQQAEQGYMDKVYKAVLLKADILKAQQGGDSPANVREYEYYKTLSPEDQKTYERVKRSQQWLNLGDRFESPQPGGPAMMPKGLPPEQQPALKGDQEREKQEATLDFAKDIELEKARGKTAGAEEEAGISDERAIPVIEQLRGYNAKSFEMPYADAISGVARLSPFDSTQKKVKNTELMRQARLDMAAPLAKQLGVNPTDKDFQASLDRIFDLNSNQESRAAQIDALEQRIRGRVTDRAERAGSVNATTPPMSYTVRGLEPFTDEDIQATAEAEGKTVEEVKRMLGIANGP